MQYALQLLAHVQRNLILHIYVVHWLILKMNHFRQIPDFMETSPYITLSQAILALKSGNVIGIPTETVYGLAADILQEQAVRQIFTLKNRPIDHPLIVHIADPSDLDVYATQVPDYAKALAASFWPGPLTLILRKSSRIGPWITGGQETVGIRLPRHPLTQALIRELGVPLAAPSANQFGKISPTTAAHVLEEFGEGCRSWTVVLATLGLNQRLCWRPIHTIVLSCVLV